MNCSPARIFALPAVIAAASTVGLVTALVDDGPGDWIAWAALAVPVMAMLWAWTHRT